MKHTGEFGKEYVSLNDDIFLICIDHLLFCSVLQNSILSYFVFNGIQKNEFEAMRV